MRLLGIRGVLVAAVVLAVGVGLWSAHDSASAQAPAASTITTQLQPGWNMIGWMGSDTAVGDLFAAVPALEQVVAWDQDMSQYLPAWRHGEAPSALARVTRGQGLFLWVGGTEAVPWTRPGSAEGILLTLSAGSNLVGWAGRDGTPIASAVARFGSALLGVSRWNVDTGLREHYRPGAPPAANTLRTLNHGDALWVRLSEESRWWQSSPKRIEFVPHGDVRLTQKQESEWRAELAHVQAFFLERYGIEPPEFSVNFFHGPAQVAVAGGDRMAVYWPADDPPATVPWAHEYFHLLQGAVGPGLQGVLEAPEWIVEGSAEYAANVYSQARWKTTDQGYRWFLWSQSRGVAALRPLEDDGRFQSTGGAGYALAALAIDWLVRRAAGLSTDNVLFTPDEPSGLAAQTNFESYIQYFRLLRSTATWQEAFEGAFGIALDDFYEAFEEYRRGGLTSLPPHVSDDRIEPVLEVMGEIPPARAAQIRMDFDAFQSFFRDRLGSGPVDYTVLVAGGREAERAAYLNIWGEEPEEGRESCGLMHPPVGLFVSVSCYYENLPRYLATVHYYDARNRAYPGLHLLPWGPEWLASATIGYMAYGGQAAADLGTLDRTRIEQSAFARRTTLPLSSMQTAASVRAIDRRVAAALGFFAGDWLVQRAGEQSLFKYYELLVLFEDWEQAFEGAFGISVTDFYTAFEAYRSEIAPSLPHLVDDRDEPILLFLGAIPEDTQTALRTKLRDVQMLFRERFGTGPVDYTLYITADLQSAADTYLRTRGHDLTHLGCWQGEEGVVLVVIVTCATSPGLWDPIVEMHFDAVALQLAPWASLPEASKKAARRAPEWLHTGTLQYADAAYRAATGRETLEQSRHRLRTRAGRTEHPLSTAFQHVSAGNLGLGFLAADWLAQRAGEPALFEYYRLLGSSATWQDAFEGAFGIAVDDFYEEFAAYREGIVTPLPHLADDVDEPVLVFEGEIPAHTVARIRVQFDGVQTFFRDRLGAPPVGYTVFVAADRPAATAVYLRVFGIEENEPGCGSLGTGYSVHILACDPSIVTAFATQHFTAVRSRLAPAWSLPPASEGHGPHGAAWLPLGLVRYVGAASREAVGADTLANTRRWRTRFAGRVSEPLKDLATDAGLRDADAVGSESLTFLAADWLATRAGERAIFEYYRLLPSSDSWQEAFEGAFGITVDDFYAAFAEYRAGL